MEAYWKESEPGIGQTWLSSRAVFCTAPGPPVTYVHGAEKSPGAVQPDTFPGSLTASAAP